jgi:hypothetical protein
VVLGAPVLGREQAIDRHVGEGVGRHAELADHPARHLGGVGAGRRAQARCAALEDHAMEQPARGGHGEQHADRDRAGGFAHHGDLARIAAERGDVVPHPAQRRDLIEQQAVARVMAGREVAEVEQARQAEPVVDRDGDDALLGERHAVIQRRRARAHDERAAVDPHHDRVRAGAGGREHVEVQAVLAGLDLVGDAAHHRDPRIARLGGDRAEVRGVADAGPRRGRRGRPEPERADRRRRERDPLPHRDVAVALAAHLAMGGLDDQIMHAAPRVRARTAPRRSTPRGAASVARYCGSR